jgi:hypothetical protein
MKRHEPNMQLNMAVLEDRAHCDRELLAARATLPKAFAEGNLAIFLWLACNGRQTVGAANFATMRTARLTIRPTLRFEIFPRTIIIVVGLRYLFEIHWHSSNEWILSN